jgi:hypothetical protein
MLSRIWCVAVLSVVVGAVGCAGPGAPDDLSIGEVVPAGSPATMPGGAVAVRYWGEVNPRAGKVDLYPIHEGNKIYRAEKIISAVNYQYTTATQESPPCEPGGTCLPSANTVRLFTDQNTVTFVENGTCVKNGVNFPDATCGGFYPVGHACSQNLSFCGDVQINSNVTFGGAVGAMPDVVIDIANVVGQPAQVLGCRRNTTPAGPLSNGGLCYDDGLAKVSSASSNFVPGIANAGETLMCAYCYGNKALAVAASRPALQHTVISGVSAEKAAVDTNKFVLKISSDQNFDIVFTVYYAQPALNVPGNQIKYSDVNNVAVNCIGSQPTRALVLGGGFGPPAECLAASFPAACPIASTPATGYNVDFAGLLAQAPLEWSDFQLRSQNLTSDRYGCPVTVNTPLGTITTDDDLKLCSAVIRRFTPASYLPRTRAGGGKLGDFFVMLGGLTQSQTPITVSNAIQVMPLPRCANFVPAFTTLSTTLPAGAGLRAAASTVASDGLYYIGGAPTGNTCSTQALRFNYSGGATGTITSLPAFPVPICSATAVTLFDTSGGAEYVVVTGGLTFPVDRVPATPAVTNADLSPTATYIWQVGGSSWTTVPGVGLARWNMGGAGYQDASSGNNKALFVGGATTVSTGAPAVTTVDVLQMNGGVPVYNGILAPALPFARSLPAVAVLGTNFYVQGGGTTVKQTEYGRLEMVRLPQTLAGSWASASTGGQARQGHFLVVSNFAETAPVDTVSRLLMVGGNDSTTMKTIIDEFNP